MWECPDYFETEGRKILSTSVQGLEGGVWDARNVYQSGYFLVEGDILSEYVLSDYESGTMDLIIMHRRVLKVRMDAGSHQLDGNAGL